MKTIFLSVVASMTLLAAVNVKAECDHVQLEHDYILREADLRYFSNTQFHGYAFEGADYGVRLNMAPDDHKYTDPFGEEHETGGGYRYEIYKDGKVVARTSISHSIMMENLKPELVALLKTLGCK